MTRRKHLTPKAGTIVQERTTKELIEKLGEDVQRCHAGLVQSIDAGEKNSDGTVTADYEYHARQLIRGILAYVEGITFSVKVSAADRCLGAGFEMSDLERQLVVEVSGQLNDKGEVVERPAKLRLIDNVRFAFRLLERATRGGFSVDLSSDWWGSLRKTIAVRDRLTHPRFPQDIDVSGEEIVTALKAKAGFDETLMSHK
jgi:hypothetical protein